MQGEQVNEVVSNIVIPICLIFVTTSIGAMGWFLKGLHGDFSGLSTKVSALHETYSTRAELERVRSEISGQVEQLRDNLIATQREVHREYVTKDDFVKSVVHHQMTLDSLRRSLDEMHTSLKTINAALEVMKARDQDRAQMTGTR